MSDPRSEIEPVDKFVLLACWDCCGHMEPEVRWPHRVACVWCGLSATTEHAEEMQDYWPWTVTGGPWPERIGLSARMVGAHGRMFYPWAKLPKSDAIILIKDDPLKVSMDGWSCVLSRSGLSLGRGTWQVGWSR